MPQMACASIDFTKICHLRHGHKNSNASYCGPLTYQSVWIPIGMVCSSLRLSRSCKFWIWRMVFIFDVLFHACFLQLHGIEALTGIDLGQPGKICAFTPGDYDDFSRREYYPVSYLYSERKDYCQQPVKVAYLWGGVERGCFGCIASVLISLIEIKNRASDIS